MGVNRKARDNFFLVDSSLSSLDYGIIISADNSFEAPKRDVEYVSVPGRNGDLIIDNGRWENVEVTYNDCLIEADFPEKFGNFRSQLSRMRGYKRLEDSFDPEVYRLADLSDIKISKLGTRYHSGIFDVTFNCKPQRFLKSGEIPIQFMPWAPPTYRSQYVPVVGDTVSFTVHCPVGDALTIVLKTYDNTPTVYRTITRSGSDGDIFAESLDRDDGDKYWTIEISGGMSDPDNTWLGIQYESTFFVGEPLYINARFGGHLTLHNPTGYVAKPVIECYYGQLPSTTISNYVDGVEQYYYVFHSNSAPTPYLKLDCDLQYLYDHQKANQTDKLFLTVTGSNPGEGTVFPEFGEDEIRIDMTFSIADIADGTIGLVNIYPGWWKL